MVIINEVIVVDNTRITSVRYVRQSHPVVRRLSSTRLGLSLLSAARLAAWRTSFG